MVNYKEGKIYRLVCDTTGKQYIGSTCKQLSARLTSHRTQYKRYLADKGDRYMSSFEILENNNYKIILIEPYPCENCDELRARERYWVEKSECVNSIYKWANRKDNKEADAKRNEEYQKRVVDNPMAIKRHETFECVCGDVVTKMHASRHKVSNRHIDYLKTIEEDVPEPETSYVCDCGAKVTKINREPHERSQKHYNYMVSIGADIDPILVAKMEELKAKRSETVVCECGVEVTSHHKARHEKSLRHTNFLAGIITTPKVRDPEIRKEKRKETMTCVCGEEITIDHKARHERTNKHIYFLLGITPKKADPEATREKYKENMTCECGAIIQIKDKTKHKRSQKHYNYLVSTGADIDPALIAEMEEHKEKHNTKVICVCGAETTTNNKARHEKSKPHLDYIAGVLTTLKHEKIPCECGGHYTAGHRNRHIRTEKHRLAIESL